MLVSLVMVVMVGHDNEVKLICRREFEAPHRETLPAIGTAPRHFKTAGFISVPTPIQLHSHSSLDELETA